jgi:hypothetical protein
MEKLEKFIFGFGIVLIIALLFYLAYLVGYSQSLSAACELNGGVLIDDYICIDKSAIINITGDE